MRSKIVLWLGCGCLTFVIALAAPTVAAVPDEDKRDLYVERLIECVKQVNREEYQAALENLREIQFFVRKNPQYWYTLGRVYNALGDIDQALNAMQKAVDVGFSWPGTYIEEELSPAIKWFERGYKSRLKKIVRGADLNVENQIIATEQVHRTVPPEDVESFGSLEALLTTLEERDQQDKNYEKRNGRFSFMRWEWSRIDYKVAALRRYLQEHPQASDWGEAAWELVRAAGSYKEEGPEAFWDKDALLAIGTAAWFLLDDALRDHPRRPEVELRLVLARLMGTPPDSNEVRYREETIDSTLVELTSLGERHRGTEAENLAQGWILALNYVRSGKQLDGESIRRQFELIQQLDRETYEAVMQPLRKTMPQLAYGLEGLPKFEDISFDGSTVSSSDFAGYVTFVDFWATWCSPCVKLLPQLIALHEKYAAKGFRVLGIALESDDTSAASEFFAQFLEDTKLKAEDGSLLWPQITSEWDGPYNKKFGVYSIPDSLLVDREGKLIAKDIHGEALAQKLAEIFAETEKD